MLPIIIVIALVAGCDSGAKLSPEQIKELESDCRVLASSVHVPLKAQVYPAIERLPASIRALKPKTVYLNAEGIYIVLQSRFVEEAGLFYLHPSIVIPGQPVPNGAVSPGPWTDPRFERIGTKLYRYRIKG